MDDHHSTALRSASSVTDDASNSRDGDQSPLPTLCDTPIHSSQEMEHDISATGTVNLPSSWVKDPGLTPHGAQDEDDGSQISAPSLSGVPPAINLTFASQIVTNPRSVTVRFQPADTHAPATTVLAKQSVFGGIAPYATAFSSSLHEAPEPQPYCAPSVRLHLARYERFWSLNPWDTAHPVTANKVFIFLDSLVLTLGHQNGPYPPVVKDTIDAFDTYRRDNSHLPVYSYPQEIFFNSTGQLMSLRYDPRLQGLESLDSCFINQGQAYKTFTNMFRLYLYAGEDGSGSLVVDSSRLHGVIRQRTVLLLGRWLMPRIAFSIVPHLPWANLTVTMLPCVRENETRREDLYLTALINLPREDGGSNSFMYTACRHQLAEVCPIGALAWYFFSEFHVAKSPPPDFALYVNTPTGEIFRPWHSFMLIPDNVFLHADLIHYTPLLNRRRGVEVGTKLSPNEYSPVEAESYNEGRRGLKPPKVLLDSIFPWIEQERRAYSQRLETQGAAIATDFALCRFLDMLVWMRTVILQDAVMFCMKYSGDCQVLRMPVFDCGEFRKYASEARDSLVLIPMPTASTLSGENETNSSKAMVGPSSKQVEVEHSLPSPLPVVDAVFNALGNENIDLDTLKMTLTAGDTIEKAATPTQRASNLSHTKWSLQTGRLSRTKKGQREKPRQIRPAGPFWESLTGIDM